MLRQMGCWCIYISIDDSKRNKCCKCFMYSFQNFELETDSKKKTKDGEEVGDSGLDSPGNCGVKDSNSSNTNSWEWPSLRYSLCCYGHIYLLLQLTAAWLCALWINLSQVVFDSRLCLTVFVLPCVLVACDTGRSVVSLCRTVGSEG